MGIKGLRKLLNAEAPGCIKAVAPTSLRGMKIAVDISIAVYEFYHVGSSRGIVGSTGMPISHIQGVFSRMVKLLSAGAIPVAIFDGKPPVLKDGTIAKRRELKAGGVKVPQSAFNDVMRLLQLMGVQYIEAPSEAEAQAAVMCREGVVDAVLTEDYDVLVFGAPKMLIMGASKGKVKVGVGKVKGAGKASTEIISLEDILAGLTLSRDSFIDLCILLGSDYTTETLRGVGPKTGLKLIKKHLSIEKILEDLWVKPTAGFVYKEARAEFLAPTVAKSPPIAEYKISKDMIAELGKFLLASGLDPKRYSKGLVELGKLVVELGKLVVELGKLVVE